MSITLQRNALGSGPAPNVKKSLLNLHRRYRAILAEHENALARADAIREGLVQRWGETGVSRPADIIWGHDPDDAKLGSANREVDRLMDGLIDVTDEIIETAATTRAGVVVKLQVAIDLWLGNEDNNDIHEKAAIAVIRDALRLLGGAA